MAQIGSIGIGLFVNTSAFEKGLKRAQNSVASFGARVRSTLTSLPGLGAVLSAAGFSFFVKRQFEAADALADTAERLSITTEALAGLNVAADRADAPVEALHNSLAIFQRNLGEAADKSSPAAKAFARLGLDSERLRNIPLDQAFTQTIQKLSEIPNESIRGARAFDVLGKGSKQLSTLIRGGSAAIEEATRKAKQFKLALSPEEAEKVRRVDNAIKDLKDSINGAGLTLAINLAPQIEKVAKALANLVTWVAENANEVFKWVQHLVALKVALKIANGLIEAGTFLLKAYRNASIAAAAADAARGLVPAKVPVPVKVPAAVAAAVGPSRAALRAAHTPPKGLNDPKFLERAAPFAEIAPPIRGGEAAAGNLSTNAIIAAESVTALGVRSASTGAKLAGWLPTLGRIGVGALKFAGRLSLIGLAFTAVEFGVSKFIDSQSEVQDVTEKSVKILSAEERHLLKVKDAVNQLAPVLSKLRDVFSPFADVGEKFAAPLIKLFDVLGKQADDRAEAAKNIIEEIKTPLEKFEEQRAKIEELQRFNLITPTQATLATAKAFEPVQQTAKAGEVRLASQDVVGSKAALEAVDKARLGSERQQDILGLIREQRDLARRQLQAAEETVRILRGDQEGTENVVRF